MKMLSAGVQGVVNVEITQVSLTALLGGFDLAFWVQGQATTPPGPYWLAAHSAEVQVGGATGPLSRLGVARPAAPVRERTGTTALPVHWTFQLAVTAHQLTAIEDLRNAGDLQFKLVITGEGGPIDFPDRIDRVHDELHRPLGQSDWILLLAGAKAMDILLLEIPMPFVEPSAAHREIADALGRAQHLFAEGRFPESVLNCRKAIEALAALEGRGKDWSSDAFNSLKPPRNDMTKDQRELALEASLLHFTHLGAHLPAAEISRRDARLAIALTASVLAFRFS
jgi:hypothetical protein